VPAVLILLKLLPEADREAYETWARTVDAPSVAAHCKSVVSWNLFRVDEPSVAGFDYIEVITGTDREELDRDLASEAVGALVAEVKRFVAQPLQVTATQIV
jgi:hypothetical protein